MNSTPKRPGDDMEKLLKVLEQEAREHKMSDDNSTDKEVPHGPKQKAGSRRRMGSFIAVGIAAVVFGLGVYSIGKSYTSVSNYFQAKREARIEKRISSYQSRYSTIELCIRNVSMGCATEELPKLERELSGESSEMASRFDMKRLHSRLQRTQDYLKRIGDMQKNIDADPCLDIGEAEKDFKAWIEEVRSDSLVNDSNLLLIPEEKIRLESSLKAAPQRCAEQTRAAEDKKREQAELEERRRLDEIQKKVNGYDLAYSSIVQLMNKIDIPNARGKLSEFSKVILAEPADMQSKYDIKTLDARLGRMENYASEFNKISGRLSKADCNADEISRIKADFSRWKKSVMADTRTAGVNMIAMGQVAEFDSILNAESKRCAGLAEAKRKEDYYSSRFNGISARISTADCKRIYQLRSDFNSLASQARAEQGFSGQKFMEQQSVKDIGNRINGVIGNCEYEPQLQLLDGSLYSFPTAERKKILLFKAGDSTCVQVGIMSNSCTYIKEYAQSPDRKHVLALLNTTGGPENTQLYLVDINGANEVNITKHYAVIDAPRVMDYCRGFSEIFWINNSTFGFNLENRCYYPYYGAEGVQKIVPGKYIMTFDKLNQPRSFKPYGGVQ